MRRKTMKVFRGARIAGTGSYLPAKILTDEELIATDPSFSKYTPEFLHEALGTRERRVAAPDERNSDMMVVACRGALEAAEVTPGEVDALFASPNPPDYVTPPASAIVHGELGLRHNCPGTDIYMACTSLVAALEFALGNIEKGANVVLLAGSNTFARGPGFAHPKNRAIFGDGAGAMVLRRCEPSERSAWRLKRFTMGKYWHTICHPLPGGLSVIRPPLSDECKRGFLMDGSQEMFFAHMREVIMPHIRGFLDELADEGERPDLVIGHQPSGPLFLEGVKATGLPLELFVQNFAELGNTISAELPMTLDQAIKEGRLKRGMRVLFYVYGAGYTLGAVMLTY